MDHVGDVDALWIGGWLSRRHEALQVDADARASRRQRTAARTVQQSIVMNLSEPYEFTDTPEPGVLRMRVAVTNLVPSNSVTGTVTTIIPIGLGISAVSKAFTLLGVRFYRVVRPSRRSPLGGELAEARTPFARKRATTSIGSIERQSFD